MRAILSKTPTSYYKKIIFKRQQYQTNILQSVHVLTSIPLHDLKQNCINPIIDKHTIKSYNVFLLPFKSRHVAHRQCKYSNIRRYSHVECA